MYFHAELLFLLALQTLTSPQRPQGRLAVNMLLTLLLAVNMLLTLLWAFLLYCLSQAIKIGVYMELLPCSLHHVTHEIF